MKTLKKKRTKKLLTTQSYKMGLSDKHYKLLEACQQKCKELIRQGDDRSALILRNAINKALFEKNMDYIKAFENMEQVPVTIEEFITNPDFLGGKVKIWKTLKEDLYAMNPDQMTGEQPITEVLLGGGIGTGKSYLSQISICYLMYWLCCFKHPQDLFGLDRYTSIVIMVQSIRDSVTKRVLYNPIREMFLDMPWVTKYIKHDKNKMNALVILDKKIELVPALAKTSASIGQAVLGGILDEMNFMQVIENSKQVAGASGKGGYYDQAEELYQSLIKRRASRFTTRGPNPGAFFIISSAHYKGDFLERRINEVDPKKDKHVKIISRMQHEAVPSNRFSGKNFRFLVGTDDYSPKILKDNEKLPKEISKSARVIEIPIEYERFFRNDPWRAQRELLGIASSAISRFFKQVHKINEAITRGKKLGLNCLVKNQNVDYSEEGMPRLLDTYIPKDKQTPRFIHVDLSKSKDRCGIAMAKVAGYSNITYDNTVESLPHVIVEFAVSIEPSQTKELDIADVRKWIMTLRDYYGLNIHLVTYDQFQSEESRQLLRKAGIRSDLYSVDRTPEAYTELKRLIYEDRIELPDNPLLKQELIALEEESTTGKLDHPPKGSKDIADAVAGAVFNAIYDRKNLHKFKSGKVERIRISAPIAGEEDEGFDLIKNDPYKRPETARRDIPRR